MFVRNATASDNQVLESWAQAIGTSEHASTLRTSATSQAGTETLILGQTPTSEPLAVCTKRIGLFNFVYRSPSAPPGSGRALAGAALHYLFDDQTMVPHVDAGGPFSLHGRALLAKFQFQVVELPDDHQAVRLYRLDWDKISNSVLRIPRT